MIRQSVAAGVLAPQGGRRRCRKKTHSSYYITCRGECSPTLYMKLASFDSFLLSSGGRAIQKNSCWNYHSGGADPPLFIYR